MTRILITRHGEAEHNLRTDVFMGRSPASRLTALGREQARSLGRRLADGLPPRRIVCSSLPRAVETAELIAEAAGGVPISREDAFWELSKGEWEGHMPRVLPDAVRRELEADPFAYRHPGGESYHDVWQRAGPAFDRWVAGDDAEPVLFVLHGDVIRALLYHVIRFPTARIGDWVIDPCSLSEVRDQEGRRLIVRINDCAHLE